MNVGCACTRAAPIDRVNVKLLSSQSVVWRCYSCGTARSTRCWLRFVEHFVRIFVQVKISYDIHVQVEPLKCCFVFREFEISLASVPLHLNWFLLLAPNVNFCFRYSIHDSRLFFCFSLCITLHCLVWLAFCLSFVATVSLCFHEFPGGQGRASSNEKNIKKFFRLSGKLDSAIGHSLHVYFYNRDSKAR